MNFKRVYVALCCLLSVAFTAPETTFAANPLGLAYNNSFTNDNNPINREASCRWHRALRAWQVAASMRRVTLPP